jgi:hypothetical protein
MGADLSGLVLGGLAFAIWAYVVCLSSAPFFGAAINVADGKRKPTIGALMLFIASLAIAFAGLTQEAVHGLGRVVLIWLGLGMPIVLIGLYVPRRWERAAYEVWYMGIICGGFVLSLLRH